MNLPRRLVLTLQAVTATGIIATIVFFAWPASTAVASVAPTLPALTAAVPPMPSTATALADSIVNANIFSLTRQAPTSRTFVAGPVDPLLAGSATPSDSIGGVEMSSTDSDPVPALYGVVNGPLGAAALLRLDPAARGSRLFHLGEGVAGYRVRSIGADRVELSGPSGPVVLTLAVRGATP